MRNIVQIDFRFYESQANQFNEILAKKFQHTFSLPCHVINFDFYVMRRKKM